MASKMSAPAQPGFYWVRFDYRAPYETPWSVSYWDGKEWTHIGNDQTYTPEQTSIVEWRGPLEMPSDD